MRGGSFHEFMIKELAGVLVENSCLIRKQVPSRKGRNTPFVDLVATCLSGHHLLIEVENSSQRVFNNIQKQKDFQSSPLWIVAPNKKTKLAVDAEIRRQNEDINPFILSCVFCDAIEWILAEKHFCFCIDTQKTKQKTKFKSGRDEMNSHHE